MTLTTPLYLGHRYRERWFRELQLELELIDKNLARELGRVLDDIVNREDYDKREIRDLRQANQDLEDAIDQLTFRNSE